MLKLGKMTSRELAAWLGISYNSYKNNIPKYLKIIVNMKKYMGVLSLKKFILIHMIKRCHLKMMIYI